MKPVYFFLGANSEEGFFSLYDQLLGGRLDDLMILKGGPGCGKSTFMRRMGAAMERAGERVVYINCSGDPDSLDAAIFLDRNAAIVDGTSPHGTAPLGHRTKKSIFARLCGDENTMVPAPVMAPIGHFTGQAI